MSASVDVAQHATVRTASRNPHVYGAVAATVVLTVLLAAIEPLWFDEVLTRTRAVDGLDEVVEGNGYGYFALLRGWVAAVGASPLALRLPSVIAVAAAIPAVWHATRRLYSSEVADAAVWALAVHPFVLWYGSEARGYAFVLLASAASLWLLARVWEDDDRRGWVTFGMVAAAGMWCHVMAVWLLPLAAVRARSWRFLWGWATAGVLVAPLVWMLLQVRADQSLLTWIGDQGYTLPGIFGRTVWLMAGAFAMPLVVGLVAYGADRTLAWWILLPLVGTTLVHSAGEPLLWPRNMIVTVPAIAVAAGRGWVRLPDRLRIPTGSTLAVALLGSYGYVWLMR